MTGLDAVGLRQLLRDELAARLLPSGWERVEVRDRSMLLAAFVRPVGGEFAASVEFHRALSVPDHPPVRVSQPVFGVSFEPLRRLWPLLDEHVHVATRTLSFGDLPEHARLCATEIADPAMIATLAARLAALANEIATPFAKRNSDLDALIESYRGREPASMTLPALLAAAGRFDQAQASLSGYAGERGTLDQARHSRRYVYQLTRWIDSRGAICLPDTAPPSPHDSSERASLRDALRQTRARQAALRAVKRDTAASDRGELCARLEAELSARAAQAEPLWLEQRLDELRSSPAQRASERMQALQLLGRVGLGVAKTVHERKLPELRDMSLPASLEPPPQAVFAVAQSRQDGQRWSKVALDAGTERWLAAAHHELPRLVELVKTAQLEVWLDRISEDERQLAVHIGRRRVGLLDQHTSAAYAPAILAAQARAELPSIQARLTPLSQNRGYLLEAARPAPAPAGITLT